MTRRTARHAHGPGVKTQAMRRVGLEPFDPRLHSERLLGWLRQPHVARWWGSTQQAMDHATRSVPGTQALIVADGIPVGYLCWQKPARQELEAAGLTDLPDELVDIDILIGEPDLVGQGVGSQALQLLLAQLRRESAVAFAGLGTSVSNVRAVRAYERAGFRLFREFQDPEWGPCTYLIADVRGEQGG